MLLLFIISKLIINIMMYVLELYGCYCYALNKINMKHLNPQLLRNKYNEAVYFILSIVYTPMCYLFTSQWCP